MKGWKAAGLALMTGLLAAGPVGAEISREYDVKAAFLYNFATFIDWPPETFARPESPFVIGVLGTDPFGTVLDEIVKDERVRERPLVAHRFNRLEDMQHCHILFISTSEARRIKEILRRLKGQPVLTVADLPGFAEAGGGIGFTTETRVGLVINPAALRAANLVVSSKLLRLAQLVNPAASPP